MVRPHHSMTQVHAYKQVWVACSSRIYVTAVQQLLTAVQHWCLVLLALPDDNNSVHGNVIQHLPHHIHCRLVCCILVALAQPTGCHSERGSSTLGKVATAPACSYCKVQFIQ